MNNLRNNLTTAPNNNSYGDPTHEYVDISIVNNSPDLQPQPIVFNQIKSNNILDDSSDYYLSCIRWSLDSQVPQIIPEMKLATTNQSFNGLTDYVINIGVGETINDLTFVDNVGRNVVFQPENLTIPRPTLQPQTIDEYINNEYYYIYSIDNFLQMINTALEEVFNLVQTVYVELAQGVVPRFVWNDNYNKIDLYLSEQMIQDNPTNNFFITMNTKLFNLFNTFSSANIGSNVGDAETDGTAYALYARNDYQPFISTTVGTQNKNVYVYTQNSSSVPSWCPAQSIEFITHSISVNPSNTGAPFYIGTNLKTNQNVNAVSNVITDFQIPMTIGTEYTRNLLYYQPQAEYRLFDLVSQQSLQNINVSIAWLDKFGFSHPLLIKYGASASLKLLLRKKTFNGV
jgi:hypothetical protein